MKDDADRSGERARRVFTNDKVGIMMLRSYSVPSMFLTHLI